MNKLREALAELVAIIDKLHFGRMPIEVEAAMVNGRAALAEAEKPPTMTIGGRYDWKALAEPAQPTHVEFWLIERGPNQGQLPHVWGIESANGIHDWTETAIEATRYPTKAAAGKAASWESHGSYVITSHSIIGAQPAAQPLSDEQINRIARQYMSRMTRPFYTKWKDGIDVEYPVIEIEQFARAIERAITAKDAP